MRFDGRLTGLAGAMLLLVAGCASQVDGTAARGSALVATSSRTTTAEPSTTRSTASTESPTSTSESATSGTEDSSVPASTNAAASTEIGQFGQAYTWTDGLEVTVAPGVPFTPSEYASADPAPAYLIFTVTITNKTGKPYDPTMFSVSALSGGKEANSVYDSDNGLTGSPTTAVLDGRDAAFPVGFGVTDPADVVLEISPGYDYDDALFATDGALAAVAPAAAEAPVTGATQAKFGQTYGWPDGLEVSVAPGVAFTPSDSSSAEPAAAYLSFTVTITNRTAAPYDPSLFFISAQSGSKEADQVFDSAAGLTGSPTTSVLVGKQASYVVGFGVADPADVVMELTAGFNYDDKAFFTS